MSRHGPFPPAAGRRFEANPAKMIEGLRKRTSKTEGRAKTTPPHRRDICSSTADSSWACFAAHRLVDASFSAWSAPFVTRHTQQHMENRTVQDHAEIRPAHDRERHKKTTQGDSKRKIGTLNRSAHRHQRPEMLKTTSTLLDSNKPKHGDRRSEDGGRQLCGCPGRKKRLAPLTLRAACPDSSARNLAAASCACLSAAAARSANPAIFRWLASRNSSAAATFAAKAERAPRPGTETAATGELRNMAFRFNERLVVSSTGKSGTHN